MTSNSFKLRTGILLVSIFLPSLSVLAQTPAVRARVTERVDVQKLATLRGNVHPLARPEFDQGVAPDDLLMQRMLLVLQRAPEQETSLRQLLDDQQVKSSSRFHQWLTPEQFGQQFGPADSDVQAVTDWLASQGFQVTKVAAGRTVIEFSGTAGLVRQVLGTEIHRFRVNGDDHWANTSDPQIPVALAPVVAGVASLNNFPRQLTNRAVNAFSRSPTTGEVKALFTISSNGTNYYALGPTDFATIYNVLPLWNAGIDGTGQTIAIAGETNIRLADIEGFRTVFGLPAKDPQIILNGPDPGINDDEIEADIDVEWSGAVAKNATIDLVVSQTTESTWGIDLSALYIIDNNLAPIMSVSYGECEQFLGAGGNAFYYATREQGAAQGITIINSTGDAGSARCDQDSTEYAAQHGLAVSGLASTPFNVAVGGTDFGDVNNWSQYWSSTNSSPSFASALSYIPETTWNSSCAASGQPTNCATAGTDTPEGIDHLGGGGGPSTCGLWTGTDATATCLSGYPKPAWQTGYGVPNDGVRDIPDVSLFASPGTNRSFYTVCDADAIPGYLSCYPPAGQWYFVSAGGTSVAAPNFAGIMALVNQKTGQRQGNANYVLYPLAAQPGALCTSSATAVGNSSCIFYDVVSGNNSVACTEGSKNCKSQLSGVYGLLVSPTDNSTPAWTTTFGYDLATGLGSVNAANLANKWNSASFNPSTTSLSTLPATITHGQPVNFTVKVTSGGNTPTGDISLIAQTSSTKSIGIGSFTLGSGGTFTGTTNMLPGGSYNVVAHYAGDGIHGSSDSAPQAVTVGRESSQTKVGLILCDNTTGDCTYGITSFLYGTNFGFFMLRMDVTNAGGQPCAFPTTALISYPCPTGSVTATANGYTPSDLGAPYDSPPGTYNLNSQGYAEDQFINLAAGTYNFVASYPGDTGYTASTSPTVAVTIAKAATTLTPCTLPTTVALGAEVECKATINTQSHGVAPTGPIEFLLGSTSFTAGGDVNMIDGTATTYASIQEDLFPEFMQGGTFTVSQQYLGDMHYLSSAASPAVTINVTDFNVTFNPGSVIIPAPGQTGTTTVVLTPVAGFTGIVSLDCGVSDRSISCAISPAAVNITGPSAVTATLTVTTGAASSTTLRTTHRKIPPGIGRLGWYWLLAGTLALAMLVTLMTGRRSEGLLFATALLVVGAWAACGGGGGGGNPIPISAPAITLSAPSLNFATPNTGVSSAAQTVTLFNVGNAPLSITSLGIAGTNSGDFSETNTCGSGVAAGANCSINVTFTPTATGSRSASISITDNASGSPHTVGLTGAVTAMPVATLSPSTLSFGNQILGTVSAQHPVTLTNTGNAAMALAGVYIYPAGQYDFNAYNGCDLISLAPGANCSILVTFAPSMTGSRSATVSISDNAPGAPHTATLTGTGVLAPTSPGTYSIQVQATNGADSHYPNVPVIVQ